MNILQALTDWEFWKEMGADLFDDTIGFAVLCVACVLMLSYLREVPPKFEKKRILCSGFVLCLGAFLSRSMAHFGGNVLEKPNEYKTILLSMPKHLPKEELLSGFVDDVNFDNIFKCALNNIIFNGFNFEGLEYQKYILIINIIVTFISLICICAGAFILMRTFKAKHIMPMAIVQIAGFLLKEVSKTPYLSLINYVFFKNSFPLSDIKKYGYNGFAYGCFMIIMIISYIFITRKKYEIFWTKQVNVGKHIFSVVILFIVYSLLIVFSNMYNENVFIKWIILVFLAVVLLFVPWRTYRITCAELQNEFYEVKREEKVELYEYSQAQSKAIRKYIHDLPKHFRIIDEMAVRIKADEISEYVHELDEELIKAKCEFSTGNVHLDDILVTELKIAKKYESNIIFTGMFPNEGIKRKDLTTIFMNLIENAIEACKKVSEKREITIDSTIVNNRVFVSISNPFEHTIQKSNGIFKTTKRNNSFHGFGISNVKNVVEKKEYDGYFSTEKENNIFTSSFNLKFKQ